MLACVELILFGLLVWVWCLPSIKVLPVYRGWTSAPWETALGRDYPYSLWVKYQQLLRLEPTLNPNEKSVISGDPDSVPVLADLLRSEDPVIRLLAVAGFRNVGSTVPEAVLAVTTAIDDPDETVRLEARETLAEMEEGRARLQRRN